jgi:predicted ATPase
MTAGELVAALQRADPEDVAAVLQLIRDNPERTLQVVAAVRGMLHQAERHARAALVERISTDPKPN